MLLAGLLRRSRHSDVHGDTQRLRTLIDEEELHTASAKSMVTYVLDVNLSFSPLAVSPGSFHGRDVHDRLHINSTPGIEIFPSRNRIAIIDAKRACHLFPSNEFSNGPIMAAEKWKSPEDLIKKT
jgi:hypothetical protein